MNKLMLLAALLVSACVPAEPAPIFVPAYYYVPPPPPGALIQNCFPTGTGSLWCD